MLFSHEKVQTRRNLLFLDYSPGPKCKIHRIGFVLGDAGCVANGHAAVSIVVASKASKPGMIADMLPDLAEIVVPFWEARDTL